MNNNYKTNKSNVIYVIENLFKENKNKAIPDVETICYRANISREKALKYLYQWWEKQSNSHLNFINWKDGLSDCSAEGGAFYEIYTSIECLRKEVEIYSEDLNFLSNISHPLGNYIINALLDIGDDLFYFINLNEQLKKSHNNLELDLRQKQKECDGLMHELDEIKAVSNKKLSILREELDASRRETTAAKILAKSLKREKRLSASKKPFYAYNLVRNK